MGIVPVIIWLLSEAYSRQKYRKGKWIELQTRLIERNREQQWESDIDKVRLNKKNRDIGRREQSKEEDSEGASVTNFI